jgi:aldose 1-epimerase
MQKVTITRQLYGHIDGAEIFVFTLNSGEVKISITNYGCTITSCETAGRQGNMANITAGFKTIDEYQNNIHYFGCIVGRYANRIGNGQFTLDGTTYHLPQNNGTSHLHGGINGFQKKVWKVKNEIAGEGEAGVVFEYISKDGEEGYPGNLAVTATCTLDAFNRLTVAYKATTDKATPVSLTNHAYFNLTGFEQPTIYQHLLTIYAAYYTEKNKYNLPTGTLLPVAGTALDFTRPKLIGKDIKTLNADMGYDHNFVLKRANGTEMVPAAKLEEPVSGRCVNIYTNTPGIQLYTANYWDGQVTGPQGVAYVQHGALALETQAFPDSPNHPSFPNTILRPGEEYSTKTVYAFNKC